jgi:hypothetical protein
VDSKVEEVPVIPGGVEIAVDAKVSEFSVVHRPVYQARILNKS